MKINARSSRFKMIKVYDETGETIYLEEVEGVLKVVDFVTDGSYVELLLNQEASYEFTFNL